MRANRLLSLHVAAGAPLLSISDMYFQGFLLAMPGCRERGPCLWAMALLRTNVRSEASDGISMTVKEPNELSVAQDAIDRAPDLHAAMAARRGP